MSFSKSKIFLIFCIAFIIGVFLGRFINYEIMAIAAVIFIIAGTVGYTNKMVFILAIAGIVILVGAFRFIIDYRQNDLRNFNNQELSFTAIVSEEPDERSDKTYLTLSKITINNKILESKLLASVNRYKQYEYGQELELQGKVLEPREYEDFSYKNYLSKAGIDGVIYNPKIITKKDGQGNFIKNTILKFKKKFTDNLTRLLPEPQNAFLSGLLLGAKRSIPQDLLDKFNMTGTSHIVAISGYNITIIAYGLDLLLQRFRKRISFVLSLVAIVLFVIATGASASVVRAGIMGGLLLIALNIGRVYAVTNALAFTAAVMLAINPQILLFDIGFQLSFLSLIGLVYFMPVLDQFDLKLPKFVKTALLATIAAQIFTLPILLINFGQISIIAPLVNILVLIVIPLTMLFGFFTGVTALLNSVIAIPFAWISWLLLTYVIKVVEIFSTFPIAYIKLQANWWFAGVYYFALILIMLSFYRKDFLHKLIEIWKPKPKTFLST